MPRVITFVPKGESQRHIWIKMTEQDGIELALSILNQIKYKSSNSLRKEWINTTFIDENKKTKEGNCYLTVSITPKESK